MVKRLPTMRDTWVQSLGQKDLLEKEMATHFSILAWKISMDGEAWQATVHGVAKSRTRLSDFTFTKLNFIWFTDLVSDLTNCVILYFIVLSAAEYPQKQRKSNYRSPGGSDGKESACNARDQGSIPGLGRSPGEGNGNPLQYSCLENSMDGRAWQATVHGVTKESDTTEQLTFTITGASQVAPVVQNIPANAGDIRDVGLIPGLGRSPGDANGYQLQYSCLENSMDRVTWQVTVHEVAKSRTQLK